VRRGDGDTAVEPELADGEIHHLRSDQAQLHHVRTGLGCAAHDCLPHRRRRQAHVVADGDATWLELLHICAPDRVRAFLVELAGIDPAHVVRLEDLGIEHEAMLFGRTQRGRHEAALFFTCSARP
jgi:hypothetical protein